MSEQLNISMIEAALDQLCRSFDYDTVVDILVVGGAAGMLTGLLSPQRVTTDCDVMVSIPKEAMAAVESAARDVARELGLAPNWLNSDVQLRLDALPDGWKRRKIPAVERGNLRVFAASRVDLIAMKVLAGREQDIEDIGSMRLRADDVAFVNSYLDALPEKGTRDDQVRQARDLLGALEVHDEEQ